MKQSTNELIESHFGLNVVDLQEYWLIINKNRLAIFGFTVVSSAILILIIFSLTPVFEGTATLLIEASEPKVVEIEEVYQMGMGRNEYYFTQFEILKSRVLAQKVVKEHQKAYRELLDKEQAHSFRHNFDFIIPELPNDLDVMTDTFMTNVSINPVRTTQLVAISFDSTDPDMAAAMANSLAKAYIDNSLEARLDMTQQATAWLSEKIGGLKEKMVESEQKLQAYRESEDLVDIAGARTMAEKDLDDTATKLAQARNQRTEAENIVSQVDKLPDHSIETLSTIPAVLAHPLVQRLKEDEGNAEQRMEELSKRYGDKHPKLIAARSDYNIARQNTANQILKVVEGIHKEYEVAKTTEAALNQQLLIQKEKVQAIYRKQYRLDELTREVTANRDLYDTFLNRIKETDQATDLHTSNARVVDPAIVEAEPVPLKPKRGLLSVAAVMVSLIIGITLAFIREALDTTIKSRDDVLVKLHSQLLGILPLLKNKQQAESAGLEYSNHGSGAFSESIRTIRTGIVMSALDNPHKILVVTSSIPGEGKTTASLNLAAAFGQMGKVLLIDADMRRPSIAKTIGIKLSDPGLSDLVAQTSEPNQCIHHMANLGFDVIPAGMVPPNPLELLSSNRFAEALAALEKNYDRIIIDTAPCEVVSDALILSRYASALIYVVKVDSTSIKIVKSGLSRLREVKAPLTGIVLNQVNMDRYSRYGYGYGYGHYYSGYYDYYGYSKSSATEKNKS